MGTGTRDWLLGTRPDADDAASLLAAMDRALREYRLDGEYKTFAVGSTGGPWSVWVNRIDGQPMPPMERDGGQGRVSTQRRAGGKPVGRQHGATDRKQRRRSGYMAAWEDGGNRRAGAQRQKAAS